MGDMGNGNKDIGIKLQKSYFDVLGICCTSEVVLVEKILQLEGIHKVSVIVPSRTVIVVHDTTLISQVQIVKALNQARLEASIRAYGTTNKIVKKWPSPYILACGLLLLASLFKRFFHPLQWLAVAAVLVGLPPIIFKSMAALRRYTLDINILMLIAVGGSIALRDYLEAGFIVFLFTIAEWLESRASHKAMAGMASLMSMAPQKAVLAETGEVMDAQNVKVGAILAVKAGEVIPIDGVVVDGRSEVDESSLTGESFPVPKQVESIVWAGTLNLDGYISVRTTALAENSAVAKMVRLVEEAQNSRSKTQRLIDSCAKYYTPAVVVIAGATVVIPLILKVHNTKHWFQLALVILVSACPCALVLSTPVSTFCALLKAARTGLLIKGGDVLETLAKTRVAALDKTGTITMGEFTVREFRSLSRDVALDKLLYWVSSIECKSSHPMASALVDYARSNSVEPIKENVSEFHIYPGEGIHGEIDGKNIYVGNKRISARAGCETVPNVEDMKEASTLGYVFSGGIPIGIFALSDTCRTGAAEAIRELKTLGVKTAMLTGDSTAAAMRTQNQIGNAIEIIHSELLPEDKVRIISDLKSKEGPTIMVGDGLNDAPALAMANVGISMGISGSAVAMETSHITLMSNDIRKIPKAIRLARKTRHKIIVNMFLSVLPKLAILALAVAGHPLLWAAVLTDVGTCLIVILNSMMLLQTRTTKEKCCGSSHKSKSHKSACKDHYASSTCGSARRACGESNCSHMVITEKKEMGGCCRSERNECGGKDEMSGCCGSERKEYGSKDGCISSQACLENREIVGYASSTCGSARACGKSNCSYMVIKEKTEMGGCCRSERNECGGKDEMSGCCGSERKEYGSKDVCISSQACMGNREIVGDASSTCGSARACGKSNCSQMVITEKKEMGGCCRSERNECGGKDEMSGCCGSERKEYGSKDVCISSQACMGNREIVGCARNCEEECHMESGNHSHKNPELITHATNASNGHLILVPSEAEHNGDGLHEDHSGDGISCCDKPEVAKDCHSSITHGDCRSESLYMSRPHKKGTSRCRTSERKECSNKDGCSSAQTCMDKREIGVCGRGCSKQCDRQNRCRGVGIIQMPEIVIAE